MESVPEEGDEDLPPARPRTARSVPLRLGDDVVSRARVLAAKRNTGYQTLLKEFVIERLYEEEKRGRPAVGHWRRGRNEYDGCKGTTEFTHCLR